MNKIKNKIRDNFTMTPNALINDESINPVARFLWIWLAAKPDDFEFRQEVIKANFKIKDDRTYLKYVSELEELGWLARNRIKGEDGRYGYYEYILDFPSTLHFLQSGKNAGSYNNKEKGRIKNISSEQPLAPLGTVMIPGNPKDPAIKQPSTPESSTSGIMPTGPTYSENFNMSDSVPNPGTTPPVAPDPTGEVTELPMGDGYSIKFRTNAEFSYKEGVYKTINKGKVLRKALSDSGVSRENFLDTFLDYAYENNIQVYPNKVEALLTAHTGYKQKEASTNTGKTRQNDDVDYERWANNVVQMSKKTWREYDTPNIPERWFAEDAGAVKTILHKTAIPANLLTFLAWAHGAIMPAPVQGVERWADFITNGWQFRLFRKFKTEVLTEVHEKISRKDVQQMITYAGLTEKDLAF